MSENGTIYYEGIVFSLNPKMLIDGVPDPNLYVTQRNLETMKIEQMMGHPDTVRKVTEYRPRGGEDE